MNRFLIILFGVFAAILLIGMAPILGGTIVWWLWPYAIPVAFPKLVADGYLAKEIPWLSAVCLTWVLGILLKSSSSATVKK